MPSIARSSSASNLDEDQVDEFKDIFEMFDLERKGAISRDTLKLVLNQFGIKVATEDFEKMFKEVATGGRDAFGFTEFMSMMGRKMAQTSSEQQLIRAFQSFDPKDTGMIPTAQLSEALLTLGDKLTRKELNELLAMIENDKQECRYKLFVEAMFAKK